MFSCSSFFATEVACVNVHCILILSIFWSRILKQYHAWAKHIYFYCWVYWEKMVGRSSFKEKRRKENLSLLEIVVCDLRPQDEIQIHWFFFSSFEHWLVVSWFSWWGACRFFLPNFIFLFYCFCMICAFYHFTECVVWHCFSYTNYLIDMVIL